MTNSVPSKKTVKTLNKHIKGKLFKFRNNKIKKCKPETFYYCNYNIAIYSI